MPDEKDKSPAERSAAATAALAQAKADAEASQTQAAADAVNPAKPTPKPEVQKAVGTPASKVSPPKPPPSKVPQVGVSTKPDVAPAKQRKSIVQITFNEGLRDVEVKIVQDQGTMTPRKIEHSTYVLMKVFRQHLGQLQAEAARKQRAEEAKQADAKK